MRRKAGAGRRAPEVDRMTAARAWKGAMPRAAEDTLGVQASVLKLDESRMVRDALGELVSEHALLAMIEGPEDRYGVAILDATVVASLIEAATTGRVASRPVVARAPTRTDAMICADVLDALLDGFETNLAEMDEPPNLAGYRYAAPLADARAMTMMLAAGPYSVFRLTVDLGGGMRQGEVAVAFPAAPRGVPRGQDVAAFRQALADNVMAAPAELEATLFRLRMPLSAVSGLRNGDTLRVPLSALAAVEVETPGGPAVARARLGQQGGFRAVRITHLAGAEAQEGREALEFEEAAPPPHPAALPPAAYGRNTEGGEIGEPSPHGSEGVPAPAAVDGEADAGRPGISDLPPLPG